MNRKAYLMAALAVAVVAIAGIVYWNWTPTADDNSTVQVAANLPLTGDLATYGKSVQEGATMALEDLQSGESGGPSLAFDWQDNAGDPKTAVSIMQQHYLAAPDIYVSGVKPQTMAIKDQVTARGTPHFVWIFDAFINEHSTNNFRTWVNYKIEAPMYVNYAKHRDAKRVAIIYVFLPHAHEEFTKLVIPQLRELGVMDLMVESYDMGTQDYKNIAVKVRDFGPDLIILNGFQNTLVGIVRALRPLDLITDGNTIGTYDMLDAAEVLAPDELEGIRVVAPVFTTRPDRPAVAEWRRRFEERFGHPPLYTHAYAYDMTQMIYNAAGRVNLPASNEEWIETLRATSIDGVTGPCSFDEDGDLRTPLEIGVYRDGQLEPDEAANAAK